MASLSLTIYLDNTLFHYHGYILVFQLDFSTDQTELLQSHWRRHPRLRPRPVKCYYFSLDVVQTPHRCLSSSYQPVGTRTVTFTYILTYVWPFWTQNNVKVMVSHCYYLHYYSMDVAQTLQRVCHHQTNHWEQELCPCLYFYIFIAFFLLKKMLELTTSHTHTHVWSGNYGLFRIRKECLSFPNHPKYVQSPLRYCFRILHTC